MPGRQVRLSEDFLTIRARSRVQLRRVPAPGRCSPGRKNSSEVEATVDAAFAVEVVAAVVGFTIAFHRDSGDVVAAVV